MFTTLKPLLLASASPRRQKFLTDLGIEFTALPADIDETPASNECPDAYAMRMAQSKALFISRTHPDHYIIGSDTIISLDNNILGKPTDSIQAFHYLKQMQGRAHKVITGLALICKQQNTSITLSETTEVTFDHFPDDLLKAYINTGEPMDKAGAYALQGVGSFLVKTINGSSTNVIGLPLNTCISILLQENIISPQL